MQLTVDNFYSIKPTKKAINLYTTKLKSYWGYAFGIFGIEVCKDGKVSTTKLTTFFVFVIIQLILLLQFIVCFIYTLAHESTISIITFYAGLLVSVSLSVFNLWLMNKRRIAITQLLDDSISYLIVNKQCMKKLWWYSLVPSLCLFVLAVTPSLCTVAEILGGDDTGTRFYAKLYLLTTNLAAEHFWIARIVLSVEFLLAILISMGFVNISVWFFNHMCHLVFYRFKHLNSKLEKILSSGNQLSSFQLSEYRKQHQLACQVANKLSDVWSPLIVFWILGFILGLCFDLRALDVGKSPWFYVAYGADVIRQLWLIVGLFKAASLVTVEAHKLAMKLVTFPLSKSALTQTEQMEYYVNYMLLSERLVNTHIGINASGLFLLNASSFLGMAGTVLTYVIVLYQSH